MVFNNLECWAMGSTSSSEELENGRIGLSRGVGAGHMDPFNPRQISTSAQVTNGYYGYSYIHAAHELNNNNNHISNYNNNNNANHVNGNAVCDTNNNENNNNNVHNRNYEEKNHVNGSNLIMKDESNGQFAALVPLASSNCAVSGGAEVKTLADMMGAATAAATVAAAIHNTPGVRCLKRTAFSNEQQFVGSNAGNMNQQQQQQQLPLDNLAGNLNCSAAKRMRIAGNNNNDDFLAVAQYFNDFCNSPAFNVNNEIQTQCMDIEMENHSTDNMMHTSQLQNRQQFITTMHQEQQHQLHQEQQRQQQMYQQEAQVSPALTQTNGTSTYQGYIQRSNRDLSRCMLSHMT